ncbi:MAG TPA: hypothetical protein VJM08_18095, partial [Anaerolineales bacterium]|nr:hypothetical protein [Anaerolineales bacterium]
LGLSLCLIDMMNENVIQILVKSELLGASDTVDGAISPSWSNDSQKIIFLSSISLPSSGGKAVATRNIWLFDISTQTAELVLSDNTDEISYIFNPIFLSGDNSVLFSGRREQFNTIFKYDIDSRKIRDLTSTGNSFDLVNFVLSPDENSFLVHIPSPSNSTQYVPTRYSLDGHWQEQLNSLANFQVISWIAP